MPTIPEYISQDSVINKTPTAGNSTLTIGSFDPPADTTIIVVCVCVYGGGNAISVSRDGQSFELANSIENVDSKSYIFYLINPNMVVADININIKNAIETSKAVAICFKNIDLDNPVNVIADFGFDVSEGLSTNIEPTVDNCLIVDALTVYPGTSSLVGAETELLNDEDLSLAGSQYVVLETAGVKSMDWSWSGEAPAAHTLVAFNPLEETVDTTSGMHALMQ